ncbi:hypothetical protein ABS71_09070 [bacterium SCN 62-11]|nr:hypothetical protein [Candidatus Eremiobacteraeota bacterium]ODT69343.1 MAG: hypothetical protein ABS71_09070 [bacterium SCN 62-11]
MKKALLALWLASPLAWAQNIHIQEQSFESPHLVRQGQLYVLLTPFAQALQAHLEQAGDGYRSSLEESGQPGPSVPEGLLEVGTTQIKLLLESGDVYVPAEAYCKALGLKTRRDTGGGLRVEASVPADAQASSARKTIPADPAAYFVTQYRSRYNPSGTQDNSNCGPTCMSMVALAYNLAPPGLLPGDRQGLILWCRQTMTLGNQNQKRSTNYHEIERVATQLGLQSRLLRKFEDIDGALAEGRLVVVLGDTTRIGRGGGGHFMLCLGRRGSDYVINDPGGFYRQPGTPLPADVLRKYFTEAIALYPD